MKAILIMLLASIMGVSANNVGEFVSAKEFNALYNDFIQNQSIERIEERIDEIGQDNGKNSDSEKTESVLQESFPYAYVEIVECDQNASLDNENKSEKNDNTIVEKGEKNDTKSQEIHNFIKKNVTKKINKKPRINSENKRNFERKPFAHFGDVKIKISNNYKIEIYPQSCLYDVRQPNHEPMILPELEHNEVCPQTK